MSESVRSEHSASGSLHSHMSAEFQAERRKQIRDILSDPSIPQAEKSRRVQALMDGRSRRSSISSNGSIDSLDSKSLDDQASQEGQQSTEYVATMAHAAAVAAEYYSSEDEGDTVMSDMEDAYEYGEHRSPLSPARVQDELKQGTYRAVHGRSYSMQDWSDEARDSNMAHSSLFLKNPAQVSRLMENLRPKCEHYERNCTLVAPCCGLAFGCRICHDECPVLPPPLDFRKEKDDLGNLIDHARKQQQNVETKAAHRRLSMPLDMKPDDDEQHHLIDRFAVKEILCRNCYHRQSSKTNTCTKCGIIFGEYHCNICNLWMSARDNPYHCEDCGFCRVGGRDNFRHCHDCGMCIDHSLFDDHNCKAGKYMRDCPICQEDLFSSRQASHEMPCGHAIHWHCFKQLTSFDTRCPVCKKTAETPDNMAPIWSAIAMGITLQPVPPDLARVVHIVCNDCERRGENRRWHFLGTRCLYCESFNTVVEQTVITGPEAAEFLDAIEPLRRDDGGIPTSISMLSLTGADSDDDASMEGTNDPQSGT